MDRGPVLGVPGLFFRETDRDKSEEVMRMI
jgi:hypothetical protein